MLLYTFTWLYNYCKLYLSSFNTSYNNIDIDINSQISQFYYKIHNEWNDKKLNNIDLLCDMLILYNKHNKNHVSDININDSENNSENNSDDNNYMKYYITGWYIHQLLNKDKQSLL